MACADSRSSILYSTSILRTHRFICTPYSVYILQYVSTVAVHCLSGSAAGSVSSVRSEREGRKKAKMRAAVELPLTVQPPPATAIIPWYHIQREAVHRVADWKLELR